MESFWISRPECYESCRLRNDVGRQLVFDIGNTVTQLQFSLFEPLDLDKVRTGRILQCSNRGIEVAMLLLQARKLRPKLAFFLFRHNRLGRGSPPRGRRLQLTNCRGSYL